ncbi:Site-specific DNA recombinase [Klenkia soli]|uniref:Site-specific DNA recombinase n=2 Tax=Klenkia soli TaxID=1052260 RepID=A0A1H0BZY7_9ACTN|nr:Site-specific DNA recombinase [Klenkia soli]
MDAQRAALRAEAERRGWDLELVEDAGYSAKDLNRPALTDALERLDRHRADVLVVSKLDRLSRSVHDFSGLLQRAERRGWSVVIVDLGVDTTTPAGEANATVMSAFAQLERRLIGQRTREALAAKRAAGVRLGRPQALSGDVVARVVGMRRDGASFRTIAAQLQDEGVPTARGGATWHASSVKAVCESQAAADLN